MFILGRLKIRGFRAFRDEKLLDFNAPVVLLYGENGRGKSSTLNAIEWCLFGEDCRKLRTTGIRERVDWLFPNQNMAPTNVMVKMELCGSDGRYTIERSLRPRGGRGGDREELLLKAPDGAELRGEEAKRRLMQITRSSFRDFMTVVYQHQETIRAILTQEPRERNDAIDRLLGLSDYRNLLDGIKAAELSTKVQSIAERFDAFANTVEAIWRARRRDLEERKAAALQAGIAECDLNGQGCLRIARGAMNSLNNFASDLGITAPTTAVPRDWHGLKEFVEALKLEIERMRGQIPGVEEKRQLELRRAQLTGLKAQYENAKKQYDNALRNLRDFERQHGNADQINHQISQTKQAIENARERLRKANARAALVMEAIRFLEQADIDALGSRCPVCGNKAEDLLSHLKEEWEKKIKIFVGGIQKELESLEIKLNRLIKLAADHTRLVSEVQGARETVDRIVQGIAEALGKEIAAEDDPLALLNAELERIERRLRELEAAVRGRLERLYSIERELQKIPLVVDVLEVQEKIQTIESIPTCPEYQDLESVRDQIAQFVDDVDNIKDAVAAAAHDEARAKVGAAQQFIDGYFRRLTNHPAITQVNLSVTTDQTGRNSYDLKDQNGNDLSPILNQGDLNALALSIFLGLACAGGDAQRFRFVMLDDPSQSLGTQYKRRLAEILSEISQRKRVILSTMDAEFHQMLLQGITSAKTVYTFSDWTPTQGPVVTRG